MKAVFTLAGRARERRRRSGPDRRCRTFSKGGAFTVEHHREGAFSAETMQSSSIIGVAAHGPAAVVDAEGDGERAGAFGIR